MAAPRRSGGHARPGMLIAHQLRQVRQEARRLEAESDDLRLPDRHRSQRKRRDIYPMLIPPPKKREFRLWPKKRKNRQSKKGKPKKSEVVTAR